MSTELSVEVKALRDSWVLVKASGEISVFSAPLLREKLSEAWADGRHDVAVSVSNADFVDSAGFGALVEARKGFVATNRAFAIVCNREKFLKQLRMMGLDRVFTIHPSIETLFPDVPEGS